MDIEDSQLDGASNEAAGDSGTATVQPEGVYPEDHTPQLSGDNGDNALAGMDSGVTETVAVDAELVVETAKVVADDVKAASSTSEMPPPIPESVLLDWQDKFQAVGLNFLFPDEVAGIPLVNMDDFTFLCDGLISRAETLKRYMGIFRICFERNEEFFLDGDKKWHEYKKGNSADIRIQWDMKQLSEQNFKQDTCMLYFGFFTQEDVMSFFEMLDALGNLRMPIDFDLGFTKDRFVPNRAVIDALTRHALAIQAKFKRIELRNTNRDKKKKEGINVDADDATLKIVYNMSSGNSEYHFTSAMGKLLSETDDFPKPDHVVSEVFFYDWVAKFKDSGVNMISRSSKSIIDLNGMFARALTDLLESSSILKKLNIDKVVIYHDEQEGAVTAGISSEGNLVLNDTSSSKDYSQLLTTLKTLDALDVPIKLCSVKLPLPQTVLDCLSKYKGEIEGKFKTLVFSDTDRTDGGCGIFPCGEKLIFFCQPKDDATDFDGALKKILSELGTTPLSEPKKMEIGMSAAELKERQTIFNSRGITKEELEEILESVKNVPKRRTLQGQRRKLMTTFLSRESILRKNSTV